VKATLSNKTENETPAVNSTSTKLTSYLAWLVAASLVIFALYLGWRALSGMPIKITGLHSQNGSQINDAQSEVENSNEIQGIHQSPEKLPAQSQISDGNNSISRDSELHTTIPNRTRQDIQKYVVISGDSVFEIATKFSISPESVLWANYENLNDNPHAISINMELLIPPVNGVLYEWKVGDTVESVASRFKVSPEDILNWPGNNIDLIELDVEPGTLVMVPGGQREFQQWIIPTIPRGRAGVSSSVYGSGACEGGYEGVYGDGAFIWPADNHTLSGNDYWSGHLGIDIAAGEGARIYAADNGVIVFSGWATGGYGYTIIIDHGNGYQTLYAHLSNTNVRCGQSVNKGNVIGFAGSTGNSTGSHLHFEIRYQGGFVNPWYVLPAP